MVKLISWFVRRVGPQNLIIFLLLGVVLGTLVQTLIELVVVLEFWFLFILMMTALLLGWRLAALNVLPGWLAGLILAMLGTDAVLLFVANLDVLVLKVGKNSVLALGWLLPGGFHPSAAPLLDSLGQLVLGLGTLLSRIFTWLAGWITAQPDYDPVVNTLVWCLLVWGAAAWAGWITRRRANALLAIFPAATVMTLIIGYNPSYANYLLPLVGASIPLIGLTHYIALDKRWQASGVDTAPFGVETFFTLLLITAGLLSLAAVTPSISPWDLIQRWFQNPVVSRVKPFASSLGLEGSQNPILSAYRSPGLPQSHLLGSGPELSEQIVMTVDTGEAPRPPAAVDSLPPVPRYYWRGLTYDRYTGRGWATSRIRETAYSANQAATTAAGPGQLLHQTVTIRRDQANILYAAGTPASTDQPYTIFWRGPDDIFLATVDAQVYQVDSRVTGGVGQADLRNASTNYPEFIRARYLALPDDIPPRILRLARDLTAVAPTPYDRAKAIESYLRKFPYSLNIPKPPYGRDVVDYFLFDLQKGYCDYYASAMVVLARAAGLPARLAVGYAPGRFNPVDAHYVVTAADAHSWPEIYFPPYGWIDFEPTAAQPVNERAETTATLPPPAETTPPAAPPTGSVPLTPLGWWSLVLLGVVAVLLVGLGGWGLLDMWRLRHMPPAVAVVVLFQRLQRHGNRLAIPLRPGDTPFEFATAFTTSVGQLAAGRQALQPILPYTEQLTRLYVQAAYSHHPPASPEKRQALQIWRDMQWRLWLLWAIRLIKRP